MKKHITWIQHKLGIQPKAWILILFVMAALFGGSASGVSRLVYILVCISALWCVTLFFREDAVERTAGSNA